MKNILKLTALVAIVALGACNKDVDPNPHSFGIAGTYSSMSDFYSHNGVPMQQFIIHASTGGSFTTPQGTVVTIPANAFVTMANQPVSGDVIIQFKDIYKKSDMLLSNRPTQFYSGAPMVSAGEFYIKALSQNQPVQLAAGNQIDVFQPNQNNQIQDSAMAAFGGDRGAWEAWLLTDAGVAYVNSGYIFSLYHFATPADSGSWCNSDNSSFFNAFTQSVLTIHPNDDPTAFHTDVFLVFQGLNTMVHVYGDGNGNFPYNYAPQGLQCTVVAMGIKDGNLYSSFTPITIGANMTVNLTLTQTTSAVFQAQLNTLN